MTRRLLVLPLLLAGACTPEATPKPADKPETTASSAPPPASVAPVASSAAPLASAEPPEQPEEHVPDIEYVPTPMNIVNKMLEVAKIQKTDVLYDLGCGDGRIVVEAAKRFGIKAIGYDIDPVRVKESRANVAKAHVENLVTIEQKDIFTLDLSPATVITSYLLPELNVRLIPQLEKLKPGSRVVSHDFDMEGVEPEKVWTLMAPDHRPPAADREHYVYLWKVPLKKVKKK